MTKSTAQRVERKARKTHALNALDNMIAQLGKVEEETKAIPEGQGVPGKWLADNFAIIKNEMRRVKALIE